MTRTLLIVLALAALVSCASGPPAQTTSGGANPPAVALDKLVPDIDAAFIKFQQDKHFPGMVWGIVQNGRLVHVGATGVQDLVSARPVNADSLFRIASMSKAFTALAILKLRDDGKLSLDAAAETYVPELAAWSYPTTDSPRIRVRDLLSHVGGLVTDDPWGDRQQAMSEEAFTALLQQGVSFSRPPQTAFEYSNLGYALLGRIISNVAQRPFDDYIQAEIMAPRAGLPLGPRRLRARAHAGPRRLWRDGRRADECQRLRALGGLPARRLAGPQRRRTRPGATFVGARAGAGPELSPRLHGGT
jgi:CubicO group peptidase (beta-lactamase class C family)